MSPDPELPPPAPPLAETIALDQAGAAIAESAAAAGPVHARCENCDTPLSGPYCHQCGQHDFDVHRSFRHLFLEAVDTLFNLEGRFFRSIAYLLIYPGRLTAEFNAGKRIAQMPPFRLYIFVSFLFFLVMFLDSDEDRFVRTTDKPHKGITVNGQPVIFGEIKPETDASAKPADATEPAPAAPAKKPRLVDRIRATADAARAQADGKVVTQKKEPSAFANELDAQLRRINDPAHRQRLSERIQANMPHLLMLCLPLFALFTRFLFRKSGLMYLQHLVLALHFHTFIYLWMLCSKGWVALADLPGWGLGVAVSIACTLWLWAYPVLMLRRLFAGTWTRTVLKALALALAYTLTLTIGFITMAVVSVLLT